ncbi:uncharacterized protein LOC143265924 [Megachile rotundata]|uniref:uncharacterized protein LOC143265924 n=1 Tax=Megachile rotundata TaxID=143995 RepID=UPI003FD1B12F
MTTGLRYKSHQLFLLFLELSNTIIPELWDKVDRLSYEQALKVRNIRTQKQKEKFTKLHKPKTQVEPLKDTVKNLTDLPLTPDTLSVLAKGHKFAITPKSIPTEEIISQVENAIHNLPTEQANEIRRLTTNTLKSAKAPTSNLTKSEQKALQDIRKRKDILILPADKGNMTVIMDRNEYVKKVHDLLDNTTYRTVNKDPTPSVERATTTLIKNAKLPDPITKAILPKESKAPRLYGLPKIHKPNIPLRPIISTIGSPTYKLSKYLTSVLKPLTGNTPSSITNSSHFISKIQDIRTLPHDILVSFDVQSLFTNVPIKKSIEIIQDKVPENLVPLIQHCLNTNYFIFQGTYYEQVSGAAMGSPISPVVADIYMEATCISEQENLANELEHIRSTLQQNGYSKHKINRTIDRLTNHTTKPTHKHTTDTHDKEHATTFLPYIQGTTDRIGRILREHNIRTVFTTHTKIGQLLTSPKDPQPQLSTPGVYKIPCSCGQVYIGETGRSVNTRLKEHERCARLGYIQSAVAEHQITTGHKILFEKTEVLAKTSAYLPRKHREAIEIRKHPNNINRETGYHINPIWHTLFPVF